MGEERNHQEKSEDVKAREVGSASFTRPGEGAMIEPCLVVGIGASAGGQEALEHIFTTVPDDCNLSFVVIMHIPDEGPSFLADLIRRYTSMEVMNAEDGMPLQPNKVHVIPAGAMLTVKERRLRLNPAEVPGRTHHPIDCFFTSLAADCGAHAIAVVLSGFGLDGSEGVKRVKEGGGIVLVQEPGSAIHPSMPRNAISTGAVDMVLPTEEISERIAVIAHGHCPLLPQACLTTSIDEELKAIFVAVKARTGHDFSSYKRNTVLRRIERRMTVNEAGGLRKYLAILEEKPQEAQALCQEILIGVTSFFRDPEAFEVLGRDIIPRLFVNRDADDPVRIWHACCATGEEAYSVAMLIHEHMEKEGLRAKVQIFATDIDEGAVAQARAGLYSDDIVQELGEERLKNFFTRYDGRWQVAKRLREMVVFAHHSIIKDAPFSRLDLLVCRNFLIYLDQDMQKRLISLFHMVLKPGGFLFIGASENVGRNSELFATVDKKWKIFRRLESERRADAFFPFTTPVRRLIRNAPSKRPSEAGEPTPGAVAESLLVERYAPPCLIVNEKYEVLHISTGTKRYMEVPVGKPTIDILRMAREELRPALRAAIYKAFTEQKQVAFRGVKLVEAAGESAVNVLVEPLAADPAYGNLVMVILEPVPPTVETSPAVPGGEALPADETSKEILIRQLEEQLRITHEQLKAASEQLETSNESFLSANEELMSINEEFQSTNEELQSTNEELETSKEELQALNEELATVNSELQGKVEELNQSNSDMENLFASSEIAAIFLDRGLIIKRFSPAMAVIFNLIPADIGRPFRHLAGTIDWPDLPGDARSVLENLVPVEREVNAMASGRSYIMRVLPYRTTDNRVDGVVVTLVDVNELKKAEEDIRSAALFPLENPAPVLRIARDGTILFANRAAEPMLEKWRAGCVKGIPDALFDCISGSINSGAPAECEISVEGRTLSFSVVPFPERDYANLYSRDVTKRKLTEDELRRAKEEWERTFDSVPDLIAIMDDSHRIVRVNRAMAERLGASPEQCVGLNCYNRVHGTDKPPGFCPHVMTLADGREHLAELHEANLGGHFMVTTTPLHDEKGRNIGSVHVARDITERKRAEEELRQSREDLNRAQEVAQIGSWRLDVRHNVLTWSDENYSIFGVPKGTPLTYETFLKRVHTDDRQYVDTQWKAGLAGEPYDIEHRLVTEGEVKWVREKAFLEFDDAGELLGGFGITHDLTKRKKTEEELRLAKEAAEAANRAKSLFLANMSHELRTPMTGVLGMLEIARSGMLDEKQREAIDTAHMSGRSLLMILNDILDLTRIETGKLAIEERPFAMRECLSGTVDILIPAARSKGLDLQWSMAGGMPETLIGDRVRIQQVLTNLVGNAVKFTDKGKVEISVASGMLTAGDKREIAFSVSDTGIGIPAHKMEMIFQSFCQADDSHSRRYGGTGLGLAISREIVELMGGTISCESSEGEGSSFTFTIPMAEVAASPEPATATPVDEAVHKDLPLGRRRLLIAEDDEVTRKVLGFMLQKSGYDFDFAEDGLLVVEKWENGNYDMIVMDGQMPGMDGFTATRTIRELELERGGHIPIVAMTAHALKEDRDRCLAAGMDDYVSKPIDFKKCMDVIRGLLD
jgi:two-component system, chemotaxis family, CheB/CheR fusion protein